MKTRKFKSTTGYQLAVFLPARPAPVYVPADSEYETADPVEVEALRGSPDVVEIKDGKKK